MSNTRITSSSITPINETTPSSESRVTMGGGGTTIGNKIKGAFKSLVSRTPFHRKVKDSTKFEKTESNISIENDQPTVSQNQSNGFGKAEKRFQKVFGKKSIGLELINEFNTNKKGSFTGGFIKLVSELHNIPNDDNGKKLLSFLFTNQESPLNLSSLGAICS